MHFTKNQFQNKCQLIELPYSSTSFSFLLSKHIDISKEKVFKNVLRRTGSNYRVAN